MIQYKKKPCRGCNTPQYIFGLGLCKNCYNSLKAKQYTEKRKLKRKKIKQISEKARKESYDYKKIRAEFMEEHDVCQANLPGCLVAYPVVDKSQLECHHMKGRGIYLTDKRYFLCVCNSCHRWITDHSREAIEMGLSLRRIT